MNVTVTRVLAYSVGGFFAAMAGLALTATTGIGTPYSGNFITLNSVAAAVLGGVSLAGGKAGWPARSPPRSASRSCRRSWSSRGSIPTMAR